MPASFPRSASPESSGTLREISEPDERSSGFLNATTGDHPIRSTRRHGVVTLLWARSVRAFACAWVMPGRPGAARAVRRPSAPFRRDGSLAPAARENSPAGSPRMLWRNPLLTPPGLVGALPPAVASAAPRPGPLASEDKHSGFTSATGNDFCPVIPVRTGVSSERRVAVVAPGLSPLTRERLRCQGMGLASHCNER